MDKFKIEHPLSINTTLKVVGKQCSCGQLQITHFPCTVPERSLFPSDEAYQNFTKLQSTVHTVLERSLHDLYYLKHTSFMNNNIASEEFAKELNAVRDALVQVIRTVIHLFLQFVQSAYTPKQSANHYVVMLDTK
jgi:hypothetical protein